MQLTLVYFASALLLGALHALEPGHAKTLTAAYLIGTKGTKKDALLLGLSVAFTHSLVVIALSGCAILLGNKAFPGQASHYLSLASGILVIIIGIYLLIKRYRILLKIKTHRHSHNSSHTHEDHTLMSEDEHARAHMDSLPAYVHRGERPSGWQILAFGAAGGLIPCPAAISVMLLAITVKELGKGLFLVLGFSSGLAITLVGIGMVVVMGLSRLDSKDGFSKLTQYAPFVSAGFVIFSGLVGIVSTLYH